MTAYYNEHDPHAAQWLRNLIGMDVIAPGDVDERDIRDVIPEDVRGYTQCHFFAGIGVWSYALRRAGWPDARPVWTGSCPCQPFSAAGKRQGTRDDRHLWPAWFRLIDACRPPVIFGEQVASADVVGKTLQKVRRGKTGGSVPDAQQRRSARGMQGLREPACSSDEALDFGAEASLPSETAGDASGFRFGERCEAAGDGQGDSVRFGLERHPGEDRRGILRSDGSSVFPVGAEVLGRPVAGSDHPERWLHEGEHARRSIRAEHDGEHVGRGLDPEDRGRDSSETVIERVERFIRENRCAHDGSSRTAWIDAVQFDLEKSCYTLGFGVFPACGAGAPQIRQRLFFVASPDSARRSIIPQCDGEPNAGDEIQLRSDASGRSVANSMASPEGERLQRRPDDGDEGRWQRASGQGCEAGELGDASSEGLRRDGRTILGEEAQGCSERLTNGRGADEFIVAGDIMRPGPTNGFWRDADWIGCTDGKWRPVESGSFPLVDGSAFRLGSGGAFENKSRAKMLKGYGNAIVGELAAEFISAYLDSELQN